MSFKKIINGVSLPQGVSSTESVSQVLSSKLSTTAICNVLVTPQSGVSVKARPSFHNGELQTSISSISPYSIDIISSEYQLTSNAAILDVVQGDDPRVLYVLVATNRTSTTSPIHLYMSEIDYGSSYTNGYSISSTKLWDMGTATSSVLNNIGIIKHGANSVLLWQLSPNGQGAGLFTGIVFNGGRDWSFQESRNIRSVVTSDMSYTNVLAEGDTIILYSKTNSQYYLLAGNNWDDPYSNYWTSNPGMFAGFGIGFTKILHYRGLYFFLVNATNSGYLSVYVSKRSDLTNTFGAGELISYNFVSGSLQATYSDMMIYNDYIYFLNTYIGQGYFAYVRRLPLEVILGRFTSSQAGADIAMQYLETSNNISYYDQFKFIVALNGHIALITPGPPASYKVVDPFANKHLGTSYANRGQAYWISEQDVTYASLLPSSIGIGFSRNISMLKLPVVLESPYSLPEILGNLYANVSQNGKIF